MIKTKKQKEHDDLEINFIFIMTIMSLELNNTIFVTINELSLHR